MFNTNNPVEIDENIRRLKTLFICAKSVRAQTRIYKKIKKLENKKEKIKAECRDISKA